MNKNDWNSVTIEQASTAKIGREKISTRYDNGEKRSWINQIHIGKQMTTARLDWEKLKDQKIEDVGKSRFWCFNERIKIWKLKAEAQ